MKPDYFCGSREFPGYRRRLSTLRYGWIGIILYLLMTASPGRAETPRFGDSTRIVHVYVALCDNRYQGIVPVPEPLGNGQSPRTNLYWGARYGVKSFLSASGNWDLVQTQNNPRKAILERCVFASNNNNVLIIADAYDGKEIKQTVEDFLASAAGLMKDSVGISGKDIPCGGKSELIAYVGHNGLMDFTLSEYPQRQDTTCRETIILACASKYYFTAPIDRAGACPLLWTTGLMAPEAYSLIAAIESWASGQPPDSVRVRAAAAYSRYQNCSLRASKTLFETGR
nr:hypothetical protein [candidate division Zixibacteria bacterium]